MDISYNITYRKKNKGWQFLLSYKLNGKWHQKAKQGFKTKSDAKPVAEKLLEELKKQMKNTNSVLNPNHDSITFKQLSKIYIDHISLYRENNTIQCYQYAFNKFKDLNDMKVKDIKKLHIQKVVDNIFKTKKIQSKTINTYLHRVKLLLNYYVENYDSSYDVFDKIQLPNDKVESSKKALTKQELDNLFLKLKEKKKGRYYIAALIAGTCGLRCGEILGLTWNDINFNDCTMNVNKQWKVYKKTRKHDFGELKGKKSYRIVPIPPATINELIEYKKIATPDVKNRVVPCTNGSIKKFLNPVLKEISGISIHELRHTYATLLISSGIDFKTAAQLLGHDVQQTLKTYSHVTDDMLNRASKTIAKIF